MDIAIEPEKTIDAQIIPEPISAGILEGFDDVTANIDTTSREKRVIATTISLDFNSIKMSLPEIIRRILNQFFIIQKYLQRLVLIFCLSIY